MASTATPSSAQPSQDAIEGQPSSLGHAEAQHPASMSAANPDDVAASSSLGKSAAEVALDADQERLLAAAEAEAHAEMEKRVGEMQAALGQQSLEAEQHRSEREERIAAERVAGTDTGEEGMPVSHAAAAAAAEGITYEYAQPMPAEEQLRREGLAAVGGAGGGGAYPGEEGFQEEGAEGDYPFEGEGSSLYGSRPDEADAVEDALKSLDTALACKEQGNKNFAAAAFETAASCYTEALRYLPRGEDKELSSQRAVYYCNRAACNLQLKKLEDALYDCDRALQNKPDYTKAYFRRSAAWEGLGKLDEALRDAQKWKELEASSLQAGKEVQRLQGLVKERDEKLKEEMLGKLKDMGNWVLGKFGLSIDNFKAVQDPSTGSYSISFQK